MKRKYNLLYGIEAAGGGSLKHLLYLLFHLDKALFDITVILSDRRDKRVYAEIEKMKQIGIKVIVIPMRRSIHPYHDLVSFFKISRHLRRNRYDIVHAHSSKAGALFVLSAWLHRIPCVLFTPHCFYSQGQNGLRKKCFVLIERMICKLANHIVISNNEKEYAIRVKIAVPHKLISINNAIDFREYNTGRTDTSFRAELDIPVDALVVGSVGRLTRQKDWTTFIYAARATLRKFAKVVFLIVGDGDEMADISRLIQRLDLNAAIRMPGYCRDISKVYSIMDIFVSTSRWEGLPYVLPEAMLFKIPIVSTDLGYGQIIRDKESGYLTSMGDHEAISGRILNLIENKTLRKSMGKKGYDIAREHLSFPKFILNHEQLYQDTIHQQQLQRKRG